MFRSKSRKLGRFASFFLFALTMGCNSTTTTTTGGCTTDCGGGNNDGYMNVEITSNNDSFSASQISAASITFSKVSGVTSSGETVLSTDAQTINLMDVTSGGINFLAIAASAPLGTYNQIRLFVSSASLDLISGAHVDLSVPAADSTSGFLVSINPSVSVTQYGLEPTALLMFDMGKTFQATLGSGGSVSSWAFSPTVTATDYDKTGLICGTVQTNISGTNQIGVPGIQLDVTQNSTPTTTAVTDSGGGYCVRLPVGQYSISEAAAGYTVVSQNGITVGPGDIEFANLTVGLSAGMVWGKILGSVNSAPVVGTVSLLQNGVTVASAQSNSGGTYFIGDLAAGTYDVSLSANGYAQASVLGVLVLTGVATESDLSAVLNSGEIAGTVVDASTDSAISGARVEVIQGGAVIASGFTNSLGFYSIVGLQAGAFTVQASANDYISNTVNGDSVTIDEITTQNFSLNVNLGGIAGQVADLSTSLPINGATISLLLNGVEVQTARSDANGNYHFSGLKPGYYELEATAYGYGQATNYDSVIAGQTSLLAITIQRDSGRLMGSITDNANSATLTNVTVNLVNETNSVVINTVTDYAGNYEFVSLPPGNYTLTVNIGGFLPVTLSESIYNSQTTTQNIALQPN